MKFVKRTGVVLLVLAATLVARVHAADVVINAKGEGSTYRAAVSEALGLAVEQHYGTVVSSQFRAVMASSSKVEGIDGKRTSKHEVNDAITSDLQRNAEGRVLGFNVLAEAQDPDQKWVVELAVRMPEKYTPPGHNPSNRRRMAVLTFRSKCPNFTWYGKTSGTTEWAMALADKLNVCLTQTRKFTMLDRKFDAEINDELARLSDANASPADAARLGQKLGTDYLVVGEISFSDVVAPPVNPFTGRTNPATGLFAEVVYRVLLAPTGQLKWTDTVRIDAGMAPASNLAEFISATSEAAANFIADGMMDNILPFEIVGRTSVGQLVVGQGGKTLRVGERFSVFALGQKVKDSRTGEVLDVLEEEVGKVVIDRVTDKLSYAQVVEGDPAKMVVGSRLRRARLQQVVPVVPPPPATPVQVAPSGGVVVPF